MDKKAWEQPGAHEEAPGVYRIPLPLPGDHLKAVNVYAIADGDEVVMIDGGWALADSQELLAESLGQIGYGLGDVREFLVTHMHRDHYTQAIAVRRTFGAAVALGEGERACLDALRTVTVHPDIATLYEAGAIELSTLLAEWDGGARDLTNWEDPDRWLPDGIDIVLKTRTLRVIATPGHTRGHVVFHDSPANPCSPAITCCRTSPRRSASSWRARSRRCATTCPRCDSSAPYPTPGCCLRTVRRRRRPTPASRNCSPTTRNGSAPLPRLWRTARAPASRSPT